MCSHAIFREERWTYRTSMHRSFATSIHWRMHSWWERGEGNAHSCILHTCAVHRVRCTCDAVLVRYCLTWWSDTASPRDNAVHAWCVQSTIDIRTFRVNYVMRINMCILSLARSTIKLCFLKYYTFC